MNKHISILGCGWLGLPLAKRLVQHDYRVKGSTTSHNRIDTLKNTGISPYVISISKESIIGPIKDFLMESHMLIINIPPGLRKDPEANFVAQMALLCDRIEKSDIRKVLFVSSTSVYEETFDMPIITEKSIPNGKSSVARQLITAEQIFQNNTHFKTTVLRFGGLMGESRNPAKFLSGKKGLQDPDGPINLIHQKDCTAIIKAIIKNQHWNTTFNAVAPEHPTRENYYTTLCKSQQLPLPEFDHSVPSKGKFISSDKVEQLLNHKFQRIL